MFTPRPYQVKATNKALEYFDTKDPKKNKPSGIVLPTGSGKSVVIANIAKELNGNVLVFQPNKEILEQNYEKLIATGISDAAIYSASLNSKEIDRFTYATIGSVAKKPHLFKDFDHVIIDEFHGVNPAEGQYKAFLDMIQPKKVLGLSATPYRLKSYNYEEDRHSKLMMVNRMRPAYFNRLIHITQISEIQEYLAKLDYKSFSPDTSKLRLNSTGADYSDRSMHDFMVENDIVQNIVDETRLAIMEKRKHILAFCPDLMSANAVKRKLQDQGIIADLVDGKTPKKERKRLLDAFKSGQIRVMVNVGVLTTGFDFPELDCIIIGRRTMSLALYYQIVGRGLRIHENKVDCKVVDLVGNFERFGRVEDLNLLWTNTGYQVINGHGQQITGVRLDSLF